jgi:hypothetical protein
MSRHEIGGGDNEMATPMLVTKKMDSGFGSTSTTAPRARWATVRVETDGATYVGRVYVPETKRRLSDVLADERMFISMTEVSINDAEIVEPFIAVNKQYIRTIRVLNDGEPVARPAQPSLTRQ